MNIHTILQQIAEQELAVKPAGTKIDEPIASGSEPGDKAGSRSLDDGQKLDNVAGTDSKDPVKAGSAPGSKSGSRAADNGDSLEAKKGTDVSDPVAAITKGQGTEVQGNTIKEEDELEAEILGILEAWLEEAEGNAPRKVPAGLMAALAKSTAKHKELDKTWKKPKPEDEEEEKLKESAAMKKAMMEEIEASLNEGTEFTVSISEGIEPLLKSAELSEEFASQAIELIEAAVSSITKQHLEKVNAFAAEVVSEAFDKTISEMEASVDSYLAKTVVEWKEENKLAIDVSSKTKIAESFMEGLADLLKEHNVTIPEDKEDLYEAAVAETEELQDVISQKEVKIAELEEAIKALERKSVVESFVSGLTDLEAEKVRSLSEELEFDDSFESKLLKIKESYTAKSKAVDTTLVTEDASVADIVDTTTIVEEDEIGKLASQISRLQRKF